MREAPPEGRPALMARCVSVRRPAPRRTLPGSSVPQLSVIPPLMVRLAFLCRFDVYYRRQVAHTCSWYMTFTLTPDAIREVLLAVQAPGQHHGAVTRADVLATIRRMGALQIDTIHVVARSPYFVLWSRLGAYEPHWLTDLLAQRAIFEYWSHEACFLPVDDYPIYRALMLAGVARSQAYARNWLAANRAAADALLEHVRCNGPVRSSDFARRDGEAGGWWNWKFEKMALEMLYTAGDLMIAGRERFQRVYDLRERVLPEWDDTRAPDLSIARRAQVLAALRALGAAPPRWLADYFRTGRTETVRVAAELVAEGALISVPVAGWQEPAYIHPDHLPLAMAAADGALRSTTTTLLSPFDPLVWDRRRTLELFGFDYRLECYTPASKRRYGYFTLPILHRGALIGRLDPKAHRKEGLFEIKALYLEPGIALDDELAAALAAALRSCAAWHGTPEVIVRFSDPAASGALLGHALNA